MSPYSLLRPLLFRLGEDAERAHDLALWGARLAQALPRFGRLRRPPPPALRTRCLGLDFPGPVGLAAGADKNARLVRFWAAMGFGFIEVGSVTAHPAAGNPRPRAFRLEADRALVNRMGLPNDGAAAVAARLRRLRAPVPVGVNLARTPGAGTDLDQGVADYCESFARLAPRCDYVTLNLSCPNTADGRTFAEPAALDRLLAAIAPLRGQVAPGRPLLLKLPPPPPDGDDEGWLRELLAVARARGAAGLVAGNTAPDRAGLQTDAARLSRIGPGGLSGQPLYPRALARVRRLYPLAGGLPIIGVGGVDSAETAYAMIRAGAALVQLYSALIYEGPGLPARIHRGLARLLARDGLPDLHAAVGADATRR